MCDKGFGKKYNLDNHLKSVHEKGRCDVMKKHIQELHMKIKSKPTKTENSMKIQPVEQNSNEIAKVDDPNFDTVPKLNIADSKSIVKHQLSEEYFSHEN